MASRAGTGVEERTSPSRPAVVDGAMTQFSLKNEFPTKNALHRSDGMLRAGRENSRGVLGLDLGVVEHARMPIRLHGSAF
jgi:hypothetical protein